MGSIGKYLVIFGILLIVIGLAVQLIGKIPGFGRFPGDIYVKRGPVTFYFPLVTCLLLSLILSLLLSLFWRR